MLKQAFSYKRWADERTIAAVQHIDKAVFPDAYSFALQQLNHMVIVEELFKSRLSKQSPPHENTNTTIVPVLPELENRLLVSFNWYSSFVSDVENEAEQIAFTFVDGKRGMMTVQEMLFHIINHGTYHRGNIAHALDLAGVPHPIDGYGIYIHEKEPERREAS